MKRSDSVRCWMFCLMIFFFASTASAQEMSESLNVVSATSVGERVYVLTDEQAIYEHDVETDETTLLTTCDVWKLPTIDVLFSYNGTIYGLIPGNNAAYALWDTEHNSVSTSPSLFMDGSALIEKKNDYVYASTILTSFVQGDDFFYVAQTYNPNYALFSGRISLIDGASVPFQTPNILSLAPLSEDEAIALLFDRASLNAGLIEDISTLTMAYGIFQMASDTVNETHLLPLEDEGARYTLQSITYDDGTLYFMESGQVMAMDTQTGEKRLCAYTGQGVNGVMALPTLVGGEYILYGENGIRSIALDDADVADGALHIFGEYGSDTHNAYLQAHPSAQVLISQDYQSDLSALLEGLTSEQNAYDVLRLNILYAPFDTLVTQGYCADLSADEAIQTILSQMDSRFVEALSVDGACYGVPVEITGGQLVLNVSQWEALGMDEIPTDILSFLDFLSQWTTRFADSGIPLFETNNFDELLLSHLLTLYQYHEMTTTGAVTFDNEVLREILNAFETIDFEAIDAMNESQNEYYANENSLIGYQYNVATMGSLNENEQALPLAIVAGEEALTPVELTVLMVNPNTNHLQEALGYVAFYANHLEETSANITLYPSHNDPVTAPTYQSNKALLEAEKESLQQLAMQAPSEQQASYELMLKSNADNLALIEERRYSITTDMIQTYRERIAPHLYAPKASLFSTVGGDAWLVMDQLLTQYLAEELTMDAFLSALDGLGE